MGGVPPLGYHAEDHRLSVVDSEAEIVRAIFRRYAELGSVRLLKAELEAQGIKSKLWTSASGRVIGGKPFSRGALYLILQNRTYLGEIVHKGQSHPGEHTPIIDPPMWDAVQMRLAGNTAERNSGTRTRQPSLLTGMLFDANGNPMTPSHAVNSNPEFAGIVWPTEQSQQSVCRRAWMGCISKYLVPRTDLASQPWIFVREQRLLTAAH